MLSRILDFASWYRKCCGFANVMVLQTVWFSDLLRAGLTNCTVTCITNFMVSRTSGLARSNMSSDTDFVALSHLFELATCFKGKEADNKKQSHVYELILPKIILGFIFKERRRVNVPSGVSMTTFFH